MTSMIPLAALALSLCWADKPEAPEAAAGPREAALSDSQRRMVWDLQSWGLPPQIALRRPGGNPPPPRLVPVDGPPAPPRGEPGAEPEPSSAWPGRIVLYDCASSRPTPAGEALHGLLSALSDDQVSSITEGSLAEALRLIQEGVSLRAAPAADIYPEPAQARFEAAREVLGAPRDESRILGLDRDAPLMRDALLTQREALEASASGIPGTGPAGRRDRLAEAVTALETLTGSGSRRLTHAGLHTLVSEIPAEALTPAQWDALTRSFPLGESIARLGLLELWRDGLTGRGVRVAVIDTGVDDSHPDLDGYARQGRNFTRHRRPAGPRAAESDPRGMHGTHVAGIIHGIAPEAEVWSYKAVDEEGRGQMPRELAFGPLQTAQAVADAITLAASEAERDGVRLVINLSLGICGANQLTASEPVSRAVEAAARAGVIVVAASGNSGPDSGFTPGYVPQALTVGMSDYSGRQHEMSSRAEVLQIQEDGSPRLARTPDILAPGVDIPAAGYQPSGNYCPGREHIAMTGTSMAAPHVAAAAAILLQAGADQGLELGFAEVEAFLTATAGEAQDAPYGVGVLRPAGACRIVEAAGRIFTVDPSCGLMANN